MAKKELKSTRSNTEDDEERKRRTMRRKAEEKAEGALLMSFKARGRGGVRMGGGGSFKVDRSELAKGGVEAELSRCV